MSQVNLPNSFMWSFILQLFVTLQRSQQMNRTVRRLFECALVVAGCARAGLAGTAARRPRGPSRATSNTQHLNNLRFPKLYKQTLLIESIIFNSLRHQTYFSNNFTYGWKINRTRQYVNTVMSTNMHVMCMYLHNYTVIVSVLII